MLHLYRCDDCQTLLQKHQLRLVTAQNTTFDTCPRCHRAVRAAVSHRHDGSAWRMLRASLRFPLRRDPGVALLLVALWATVFVWLAVHNAFPPMIPVALLLAVAVPVAYLADILRTAATGADDAPEPTDVSLGLGELFAPTVRLAAAIALLVAPPLAVRALGASTLTWGGLAVACALVAPAALITAAYGRPRPLIALRLIGRLTLPYLTLLLSLLAIAAAGAAMTLGVGALLRAAGLGELPLLPGWLVTATLLYGPFATAHALGRFLHRHRLDLGLD